VGESGLSLTGEIYLNFEATDAGHTLTFNGMDLGGLSGCEIYFNGSGGEWALQDDFITTLEGKFYFNNGTFDANNHNVTAAALFFEARAGYIPTIIMGTPY